MTIERFNSRWDYVGDDVSTSFDWDNLVEKATDLQVYLDGVLKTIVVDYTVAGAGTKLGSVDFLVAPANGVAVAMVRETDRDQLLAYPTNGPFPAKSPILSKAGLLSSSKPTSKVSPSELTNSLEASREAGTAIL